MRSVIGVGVLLLLLGAGLLIFGWIPVQQHHEADIFGHEIHVTETDERRIPPLVSGTIFGLGVVLTAAGAFSRLRRA